MIQVEHLSKQYETVTALHDLSFELQAGQTLVLAGTSGSGKTTTLKMINRLIEPSGGRILLQGEDIMQQPLAEMRRKMGYVIQHIGLFPHYTIAENVAVVPQLLGWEETRTRARAEELLQLLGLEPASFLDRYPPELSGGQQQRIGIARALAADPPVILMDEPFGALDPITRQQLRRDFKQLDALRSKTTLIVTHDVEEAFVLGDLICLLDKGEVQQIGTPRDLLFEPANDFVRQFIGEQRLSLAYLALQLADVREQLPTGERQQDDIQFTADTTLTAAQTQLLEKGPASRGQITGSTTRFGLTDLLAACAHYLNR